MQLQNLLINSCMTMRQSTFDSNINLKSNLFITEGLKYAGSKLKLLQPILELSKEVKFKTVLDGFAGTTRVSRLFAAAGYDVYVNDLAPWSAEIARAYLASNFEKSNGLCRAYPSSKFPTSSRRMVYSTLRKYTRSFNSNSP